MGRSGVVENMLLFWVKCRWKMMVVYFCYCLNSILSSPKTHFVPSVQRFRPLWPWHRSPMGRVRLPKLFPFAAISLSRELWKPAKSQVLINAGEHNQRPRRPFPITPELVVRFVPPVKQTQGQRQEKAYLEDQSKVGLLDAQQLAGRFGHHRAVPGQVVQDGLSEGGPHAQVT